EAAIMDLADDITYSVHDLDDFYRAGVFSLHSLRAGGLPLERFLDRWVRTQRVTRGWVERHKDSFENVIRLAFEPQPYVGTLRQRVHHRTITSFLIGRYVLAVRAARDSERPQRLEFPERLRAEIEFMKQLVRSHVIEDPRLRTQQEGQKAIIRTLFKFYLD